MRMQKRKFKKIGSVILMVAMIVTLFGAVGASADTQESSAGAQTRTATNIFKYDRWYLRSPHSYHIVTGTTDSDQYLPALYNLTNAMGNGKSAAVYCCDLRTGAEYDSLFQRTNLEDALKEAIDQGDTYIDAEKAGKLRFILRHGYSAGMKMNDTKMKALEDAAGVSGLTASEALSATQCAIWTLINPENLKDKENEEGKKIYAWSRSLTEYGTSVGWTSNSTNRPWASDDLNEEIKDVISKNNSKNTNMAHYEDIEDRITAVYNYLLNEENTEEANTVIVNFTDEKTALTVKNIDGTGVTYDVTASFKLKGTFSDKGDLELTASLAGQTKTYQLLNGSDGNGKTISADANGYYTIVFEDVAENALEGNPSISLVIDGVQTVGNDIYFYEPINGQGEVVRGLSQSFIGVGEGETPIHSETTINFEVGTQTLKLQKVDGSVTEISDDGAETNPSLSGVEFALYVKYGDLEDPVPYPGLENKTTDESGEITWEGLVTGNGISYYYKEVAPKSGYEVITDMEDADEQGETTVLSNCHDLGSLTISKTAENFSDDSPNKDRHYEFFVELDYSKADLISGYEWDNEEARLNALGALEEQYAELSAAYGKSCEEEEAAQPSVEEDLENQEASAKVKHPASVTLKKDQTTGKMTAKVLLKAGESITLSGIPAGTEHTVTELNADGKPMGPDDADRTYVMNEFDGDLIATEHAVHKGDIPGYIIKDGEIVNGSAEEEFVNVRFDEGVLDLDTDTRFSIDIQKTLDGRPSTRAFSFTLTDVTNDGNKVLQTVKNATEGDDAGRVVFEPIEFKEAGRYTFEIREVLENGYICDDNVYTVKVVVNAVRDDEKSFLEVDDVKYYSQDKKTEEIAALEKAAEDAAKENGSEPAVIEPTGEEGLLEEGESIVFNNTTITYGNYTSVGVKKVWELNGTGTASDSVTVNLLKNGKVDKTVVLNQGNNWSYTWSLLDAQYIWTVSEANVPEGFTSTVTKDGLTYIITNTYSDGGEGSDEGGSGGGDGMDITDNDVPKGDLDLDDGDVPLGNREDSDAPKTGDETPVALLIVLLALSACGFGALTLNRRKHQ